jgi:Holliday junction resolvase RusA-like endonuclease|tara:strand:- start:182 stop:556 length:375 start_codon:yes stop_codon:yes gene_type:complete
VKQVLQISAELPTLNETVAETKRHWSRYAHLKKTATEVVAWNCKAQRLKPIDDRVTLVFDWPHSRRDPDNQSFGAKMILDGLVKAGALPDDSRKWIAEIRHVFRRSDKTDQIVIVEITDDQDHP